MCLFQTQATRTESITSKGEIKIRAVKMFINGSGTFNPKHQDSGEMEVEDCICGGSWG